MPDSAELVQLREKRDAKAQALHEVFEEAGPELDMSKVKSIEGDNAHKAAEIKRMNTELTKIGEEIDERAGLEGIKDALVTADVRQSAGTKAGLQGLSDDIAQPTWKGLKAMLAESPGLKTIQDGGPKNGTKIFEIEDPDQTDGFLHGADAYATPSYGAKTTLTLSDISPLSDRRPAIVPSAQFRVMVSDLMASGTTDSNTTSYYEETTFTSAAAETAENTAKGEAALAFTLRTDTVRKIATWIPITDEALNDNAQLRSYIENRLVYMVRQREEAQLISGNGTPPNIQGIVNRSGIQTQAKGALPTPDAFFLAMQKVRVTGDAEPSAHVIHPDDWSEIRLLRTADGLYIWGNPSEAGPERLFGLPVRQTTAISNGTGLTGAFDTFAQIFRRAGLVVLASTEHASYFIENKVALLAETRLALAVYRPAAFCTVTGI